MRRNLPFDYITPIYLSPYGARHARCRNCHEPTGTNAFAHAELKGLYCTPGCAERARGNVDCVIDSRHQLMLATGKAPK